MSDARITDHGDERHEMMFPIYAKYGESFSCYVWVAYSSGFDYRTDMFAL